MSEKLKKNVQTNNTSQISYQDAFALFGANNFSFTSTGDNAEFAVPNTVTIKKFSLAPDACVVEINNDSSELRLYSLKGLMNVEVFSGLTDSEMQWIIKFLERANRFDDNKWHLPEREYAVLQILFDEKEKTLRNEFIENRSPYDEANTLLDCMRGIFTTFHEIWGK